MYYLACGSENLGGHGGAVSMVGPRYFPSTSRSSGNEMVVKQNFTHSYQSSSQNCLMLAVSSDMIVLDTSPFNLNMSWAVCDLT